MTAKEAVKILAKSAVIVRRDDPIHFLGDSERHRRQLNRKKTAGGVVGP
jgi:hypothetical protein